MAAQTSPQASRKWSRQTSRELLDFPTALTMKLKPGEGSHDWMTAELDSPGRIPGRADPDRLQDSTGSELLHRSPRVKPAKQETRQPPQNRTILSPAAQTLPLTSSSSSGRQQSQLTADWVSWSAESRVGVRHVTEALYLISPRWHRAVCAEQHQQTQTRWQLTTELSWKCSQKCDCFQKNNNNTAVCSRSES